MMNDNINNRNNRAARCAAEFVKDMVENGRFNGQIEIKLNGRKTNSEGKTESINFDCQLNFNELTYENTSRTTRK